MKQLYILFH